MTAARSCVWNGASSTRLHDRGRARQRLPHRQSPLQVGRGAPLRCAEVMREEYKAIVEAGLVLQLDDPATATGWDMINPEPRLAEYQKFTMVRIEALNHALRGLPPDRIRYHLCCG